MKSNNIPNSKENTTNKFLGSYITGLKDYPDRSYISISLKDGTETVYIMIFKQAGYGKKKYNNPLVKIITDAYYKSIPIACVYTEGESCNVMLCAYTNFSVDCSSAEETKTDNSSADIEIDEENLPY